MEKYEASMTKQQLELYAKDLAKIFESEKAKRAELDVAHSMLKSSFEAIDSGIVSLDVTLDITNANHSFCILANKTIEEIKGKSLATVLPSDNWSRLYTDLTELTDPDKILINVYGDSSLYYYVSRSQLLSKSRKLIGWVLVFSNETELRRTNKLKDEFISIVSHEIRTPLTVIIGYIDLLIQTLSDRLEENEMTYLKVIQDYSDRLIRTVKEMMELANQSLEFPKVSMEVVDMRTSVESALSKAHQVIHAKQIRIEKSSPEAECAVFADQDMLTMAILHILENAVEFSHEQSTITVTLTAEKDQWLLTIQDQGIGIPKSEQNKVFDTFYQVEKHMTRTHEGIGLGLPIVMRTASLHGGTVSLESKVGKGTKVLLRIPKYNPNTMKFMKEELEAMNKRYVEKSAESKEYHSQLLKYAEDFRTLSQYKKNVKT